MSLQEFLNGFNIQEGDVRGVLNHVISSGLSSENKWQPCVDVVDTTNNLYIYAEIPGAVESSISVDFFNNRLTIVGEKLKKYNTPFIRQEIVYGRFKRNVLLPISVTKQVNVSVKYANGILTICVDKQKERANQFSVRVGDHASEEEKAK